MTAWTSPSVARAEPIQQVAALEEWRWTGRDDAYAWRWPGAPFIDTSRRGAYNIVSGSRAGFEFVWFEYEYPLPGRAWTDFRIFSVWALRLPAALPKLEVEPGIDFFGGLETESEQFNRAFRVDCEDDRYGLTILHPRMLELLLDAGELRWRIAGDHLLSWEPGYVEPPVIGERLDLVARIAGMIPAQTWRDHGAPPG